MLAVFVFSVLFLGKCASAFTTAACPSTVVNDKYNQVLGDRCYRFELEVDLEYFRAENFCEIKGGKLVKIESQDVNQFLHNHLRNTYDYSRPVWIGLNDDALGNSFFWVDGTPLRSYSNWGDGEGPRGRLYVHNVEDCVAMDREGVWRDYRCTDRFLVSEHKHFICEFPVVQHPTTTSKPKDTTPTTTVESTASPTTQSTSAKTPTASATTPSASATTRSASGTTPSATGTTLSSADVKTTMCPEQTWLQCGLADLAEDKNGCVICRSDTD